MKTSKVQNSRNANNSQPYFPALLTTPIPDSKKFAPNHHLVSDISLLSEAEPSVILPRRPKVQPLQTKFSNLPSERNSKSSQHVNRNTNNKDHHQSMRRKLTPKEKMILHLRRKHGLPMSDSLDYNLYSSLSSDSSEPESDTENHIQRKPPKKPNTSPTVLSKTPLSETIPKLKKNQDQLKAQFEKFMLENANSRNQREYSNQTVLKELFTSTSKNNSDKERNGFETSNTSIQSRGTDVQVLECIKKQDLTNKQLQLLSKQMEELLNLHKVSNNRCESVCSTKSLNSESKNPFLQKARENVSSKTPKYKNTQTMTSFIDEHNKSLDYLDTSIEKVREDMRKDFDSADLTPISQKINSMFVEPETIYYTPDKKLDSNSSVSSCSNKHRSSCSSDSLPREGSFYRTSSPKREPKKKEYRQTNPFVGPTKQTLTRVYHTEQSFYVQNLASKYDLDIVDDTIDLTRYKQLPTTSKECFYQRQECQTIPKTLWNDSVVNDSDFQRYSLSNLNTSVATKNYLEKYGLVDDKSNSKNTRRKVFDYHNNRDVIAEENESSFADDSLSSNRTNDHHHHHRSSGHQHSKHQSHTHHRSRNER